MLFECDIYIIILDECNAFLVSGSDPTAYIADVWCLWCCAYRCMAYNKCWGVLMVCFFLWRELIVKEYSKLWERQYIIIILKRRKFEVTIHHCPEVWCSFELKIEYTICTAFVAFIVFICRNTVGRVWGRQDIFPSRLVFQPLLSWPWARCVSLSLAWGGHELYKFPSPHGRCFSLQSPLVAE